MQEDPKALQRLTKVDADKRQAKRQADGSRHQRRRSFGPFATFSLRRQPGAPDNTAGRRTDQRDINADPQAPGYLRAVFRHAFAPDERFAECRRNAGDKQQEQQGSYCFHHCLHLL